jgi:hypothetical protein
VKLHLEAGRLQRELGNRQLGEVGKAEDSKLVRIAGNIEQVGQRCLRPACCWLV